MALEDAAPHRIAWGKWYEAEVLARVRRQVAGYQFQAPDPEPGMREPPSGTLTPSGFRAIVVRALKHLAEEGLLPASVTLERMEELAAQFSGFNPPEPAAHLRASSMALALVDCTSSLWLRPPPGTAMEAPR